MSPFSSFLRPLSISILFATTLLPFTPISAQTTSRLIKGSGPTVYFQTSDHTRHAFPQEAVFKSWYPDFKQVTHVSNAEVEALTLKGNVTYRPGSVLVKTMTDSKVYTIAHHRTLRWIPSEALAEALYGKDWRKRITDLSTSSFKEYQLGDPIASQEEYVVRDEMSGSLEEEITTEEQTPPAQTDVEEPQLPEKQKNSTPPITETPATTTSSFEFPTPSSEVQISVTPTNIPTGSRVSFNSMTTAFSKIDSHKIYAIVPGTEQPVLWQNCGHLNPCATSTPFYRSTTLFSEVKTDGKTLYSAPVLVTATGGEAPKPVLKVTGHPSPNHIEIEINAPSGEQIGATAIVNGKTIDDPVIALCQSTCNIILQVNVAGSLTAFTWIGGAYEASNTLSFKPE